MVSGLTQINGRNVLTWEEKFVLDSWSMENRNLWFHTKILCKVAFKVARRDGINLASSILMPVFIGSKGS